MEKQSDLNAYYSAPWENDTAKLKAYIQFIYATRPSDSEMTNKVDTDRITWDINLDSEIPNGLRIGLYIYGTPNVSSCASYGGWFK